MVTLELNDAELRLLIANRPATFLVRVAGDSMMLARLFDGDLGVVDREAGCLGDADRLDRTVLGDAFDGHALARLLDALAMQREHAVIVAPHGCHANAVLAPGSDGEATDPSSAADDRHACHNGQYSGVVLCWHHGPDAFHSHDRRRDACGHVGCGFGWHRPDNRFRRLQRLVAHYIDWRPYPRKWR